MLDAAKATQSTTGRKGANAKALKRWRRVSQLCGAAIFGQWSFYGIFRCPFIVPFVSCQSCPVITCHGRIFTLFWGFWLLLPISVFIFGRAFCGWACPAGLVHQLIAKAAPVKLRAGNIATRMAPYLLLLGIGAALYFWWVAGQSREAIPIRTGGFFESVRLTFEHAQAIWIIRTLAVLGVATLGLLVSNTWCRFACPTGGLLEWLKPVSVFNVYKTDRCNDCGKCALICEMDTRPAEANCTNCGDCLAGCPRNAIHIGRRPGRH
ncbi:MAG: 4Fe-4S binding protein [Desulfatitalea sp.]|nr:4Fe-4S binding protein [Desulfatitalea sp.]NNJ98852.1 4Fe-4S binding protein [Desulfatitalea sp.]